MNRSQAILFTVDKWEDVNFAALEVDYKKVMGQLQSQGAPKYRRTTATIPNTGAPLLSTPTPTNALILHAEPPTNVFLSYSSCLGCSAYALPQVRVNLPSKCRVLCILLQKPSNSRRYPLRLPATVQTRHGTNMRHPIWNERRRYFSNCNDNLRQTLARSIHSH